MQMRGAAHVDSATAANRSHSSAAKLANAARRTAVLAATQREGRENRP
jgi:hypothetical protein